MTKGARNESRILDIDIDVFVDPIIRSRSADSGRPNDDDHTIPEIERVSAIARDCWRIESNTPISLQENHDEIIASLHSLINRGIISPPFVWIHIDAHDDFFGFHSYPMNEGNFMFELVRLGWCNVIAWIYPNKDAFELPYYYNSKTQQIEFGEHKIPYRFYSLDEFNSKEKRPPDFCFLTKSPKFSPPKADRLLLEIASLGDVV